LQVLVIDECYVLADSNYGNDALNTLVERVQPGPGEDLAVIMAGYEPQVREMFRTKNPGLARRWKLDDALRFEDYTDGELAAIMVGMAGKEGLTLAPAVAAAAVAAVLSKQRDQKNFGNAGAVKNLLDTAKLRMQARLTASASAAAATTDGGGAGGGGSGAWMDLTLEEGDFFEPQAPGAARAALARLVNAGPIVERVARLEKQVRAQQLKGVKDRSSLLQHWRFVGPPGTGKTTVARAFAEVYRGLGLLSSDRVVEVRGRDLMGSYVGQTAPAVTARMEEALGGVLFIDEAYGLASGGFAADAVETLLGNLTDERFKGKLVVVVAGYAADIRALLDANQGMQRRFSEELQFEPWAPSDCVTLVRAEAVRQGAVLPPELEPALLAGFAELSRLPGWGNAGDAVTVANKAVGVRDERLVDDGATAVDGVPLAAGDVAAALEDLLRQRRPVERAQPPGGLRVVRVNAAGEVVPPVPPAATAAAPPPQRAPPRIVLAEAEAEAVAAADGEPAEREAHAPPTLQALMASLEAACTELRYSLRRVHDITTSRALPAELVALVAAKVAAPPEQVAPLLLEQCGALAHRVAAAIAEEEAEAVRRADALAAIAAAEEAEREALLEAERQRQRKRVRFCVFCGSPHCGYMPRDFEVDADGTTTQVVQLIGGGSVAI
jgi:hypothetical protein